MNLKDSILNRINELLEMPMDSVSPTDASEITFAVISILESIYGVHSTQVGMVETLQQRVYSIKTTEGTKASMIVRNLRGYLRELKAAIEEGRIVNIQSVVQGEVLGNFLVLAREALDEAQKNVAAVLACAALEDALKRCASEKELDVEDQDMSEVVNALKSKGVIRGAQGQVLRGYVRIRNKAFHAEWDAVDVPSVNGIIAFTEMFLIEHFSSRVAADSPPGPPADE